MVGATYRPSDTTEAETFYPSDNLFTQGDTESEIPPVATTLIPEGSDYDVNDIMRDLYYGPANLFGRASAGTGVWTAVANVQSITNAFDIALAARTFKRAHTAVVLMENIPAGM